MRSFKQILLSPYRDWDKLVKSECYISGLVHGSMLVVGAAIILFGVWLL